jgi:hypothetical protein
MTRVLLPGLVVCDSTSLGLTLIDDAVRKEAERIVRANHALHGHHIEGH